MNYVIFDYSVLTLVRVDCVQHVQLREEAGSLHGGPSEEWGDCRIAVMFERRLV